MATIHKLVQGDTGPQFQITLTDEDSGAVIDLTGGTVTLHFRAVGSTTVLFSRLFTLTDAANGVATLQFNSGDLDQDAGRYEGEIEVVLASGVRETLYDRMKFRLREDFA